MKLENETFLLFNALYNNLQTDAWMRYSKERKNVMVIKQT